MQERLQQIQQDIERAKGHLTSPAEDAVLDICGALLTEIAMLDAEICVLSSGEGPTGCADDNDPLSQSLRGMTQQDLNRILDEALR